MKVDNINSFLFVKKIQQRKKQILFNAFKSNIIESREMKKRDTFIDENYIRGLKLKSIKALKLVSRVSGKENIIIKMKAKLKAFEEVTVKSKEEEVSKLRKIAEDLELAIRAENAQLHNIKEKLDQAFLRGATAVSLEALNMSQVKLESCTYLDYMVQLRENQHEIQTKNRYYEFEEVKKSSSEQI